MTRKTKSKTEKQEIPTQVIPEVVHELAAGNAIDPGSLLAWKIYPDGKVVLVAGNGMKFIREAAE